MTLSITKLMNETEENFSAFDSIEKVIGPTEEEATQKTTQKKSTVNCPRKSNYKS